MIVLTGYRDDKKIGINIRYIICVLYDSDTGGSDVYLYGNEANRHRVSESPEKVARLVNNVVSCQQTARQEGRDGQ